MNSLIRLNSNWNCKLTQPVAASRQVAFVRPSVEQALCNGTCCAFDDFKQQAHSKYLTPFQDLLSLAVEYCSTQANVVALICLDFFIFLYEQAAFFSYHGCLWFH